MGVNTTDNNLALRNSGRAGLSVRLAALPVIGGVHKPCPSFREIPLTRGMVALVDTEDFERISKHKWYAANIHGGWYAVTNIRQKEFPFYIRLGMHRLVLNLLPSFSGETDHKDGNTLDNRKLNLRACTHTQNMQNRRKGINNTSGYKGLWWCNNRKKWRVRIRASNVVYNIGTFTCLIKAAVAYDRAAIKYHKEFARLNFPELKRN